VSYRVGKLRSIDIHRNLATNAHNRREVGENGRDYPLREEIKRDQKACEVGPVWGKGFYFRDRLYLVP